MTMTDFSIDPTTSALVLIDLQHGIVAGDKLPHTAESVVANGAALAAAFRARSALVVLVSVDPGPNGELFPNAPADRPRPAMAYPADFATLVAELDRQPSDVCVVKHQPNAFYCTDLAVHLRRRGLRTIVLGGIATNLGVEGTARAAHEQGFSLVFAEDAMTARAEVLHTHAVTHFFPSIGRVRSTRDILAAIG